MTGVTSPPDELTQVTAWVEKIRVLLNSLQTGHLDAIEEQRQKLSDVITGLQAREAAVKAREDIVAAAENDLAVRKAAIKAQLTALADLGVGE